MKPLDSTTDRETLSALFDGELQGEACLCQGCVDTSLLPTKCPFPLPNPLISAVTTQQ